jgi:nucleoside-diphosphate-sugar epimerase
MKILITGGAGFLGSIICRELLRWKKEGREVVDNLIIIDNLMYKQNTLAEIISDPRVEFHKLDVLDFDRISALYQDVDFILPAAALTGAPMCNHNATRAWEVNYSAIKHLMFEISGTKTLPLLFCSNSGYGRSTEDKPVDETSPLNPVSVYGQTKVMAEKEVIAGGGCSLRLATVMGISPFMRLDLLVNTFVFKALKERSLVLFEKDLKRNFVHNMDVVQAVKLVIEQKEKCAGQIFNLGLSSANLSKLELAQAISKHTECHILEAEFASDQDSRDYVVDNSKIEQTLGFSPEWDLDRTIKSLLKYYQTINLDSHNVFYENWTF